MEDDTKLKIVFFTIIILFTIVCVGIWEMALEPLISIIKNSISF